MGGTIAASMNEKGRLLGRPFVDGRIAPVLYGKIPRTA